MDSTGAFILTRPDGTTLLRLNPDGSVDAKIDDVNEAASVFVENVIKLWTAALDMARKEERDRIVAVLRKHETGVIADQYLADEAPAVLAGMIERGEL